MPKLLFTLLILISIPILFFYGKNNFIYPIDEIDVIAQDSNYDYKKINSVISSLQGVNLLSVDINELRKSIMSDAWIKDVEIKKSFPSKLLITITQHKPLAVYNSKILTLDGTVIEDNLSNIELPIITDSTNDSYLSRAIFDSCKSYLDKIKLSLTKIEIHNSLIKIYTDSLLIISDRENLNRNLDRLIISFDKLKLVFKQEIKSIDMRYSNGFAIK